ncbi:hypothetical protein NL108_016523, partial [Boleophthalmus pectinirostris]
ILYFVGGRSFPGPVEFKDRVLFIGDINKRDVSIQLGPAHFSDNGTYFCDVKNPPDVEGTRARTELRVVHRESFPQKNTAAIVGGVIGALVLIALIAVVACVVAKMVRNRHNYEGCTTLDSSSSSHAPPPPRKKLASSSSVEAEGSLGGSPTGGGPAGGGPSGPLQ